MLFPLKFQRDNRKNALAVAPANEKLDKKAVFSPHRGDETATYNRAIIYHQLASCFFPPEFSPLVWGYSRRSVSSAVRGELSLPACVHLASTTLGVGRAAFFLPPAHMGLFIAYHIVVTLPKNFSCPCGHYKAAFAAKVNEWEFFLPVWALFMSASLRSRSCRYFCK